MKKEDFEDFAIRFKDENAKEILRHFLVVYSAEARPEGSRKERPSPEYLNIWGSRLPWHQDLAPRPESSVT